MGIIGGPTPQDGGPTPRTLLPQEDSIRYRLEQLALATTAAGYAILGFPRTQWFRATELESVLSLNRSTIRKHYADPLFALGLLTRREAKKTARPTFEYAVTPAGAQLRLEFDRLMSSGAQTAPRETSTTVLVASENPDETAGLVEVLNASLPGFTEGHATALFIHRVANGE